MILEMPVREFGEGRCATCADWKKMGLSQLALQSADLLLCGTQSLVFNKGRVCRRGKIAGLPRGPRLKRTFDWGGLALRNKGILSAMVRITNPCHPSGIPQGIFTNDESSDALRFLGRTKSNHACPHQFASQMFHHQYKLIVGSSFSVRFAYSRGKQVSPREICMGNPTKKFATFFRYSFAYKKGSQII
jgi:hypothetical protein